MIPFLYFPGFQSSRFLYHIPVFKRLLGIMPTWILLAEYLPLIALLAAGYILKKDANREKNAGLGFSRKKGEIAEVK